MAKKPPEALIKVSKGGTNFKMIDCEFQMGESERPAVETKADGTRLERTTVTTTPREEKERENRFVWKILAPIVVTVLGGLLLYMLVG